MDSPLDFLSNIDWVATDTGFLAIATAGLAYYTFLLFHEARRTREEQTRPQVVVSIDPQRFPGFFELVITNKGGGIAFDIHAVPLEGFSFQISNAQQDFSKASFLKLPLLKPGQSVSSYAGSFRDIKPRRITWSVSYKNRDGREFSEQYVSDIDAFSGILGLGKDPLEEISNHLEKISKRLDNHLKVDTFTSQDREVKAAQDAKDLAEFKGQFAINAANIPPISPASDETHGKGDKE